MVKCDQILFIMDADFNPHDPRYDGDKYLLKIKSFSVFPSKITQTDVNNLSKLLRQRGATNFMIIEVKLERMLDPIREEVDYAYTSLAFNSAMSYFIPTQKVRIYRP